ncbi:MAG: C40 family peptidase [Gammaproteobacteria bacterium]|nr:C40 family peptidase [Gammaproteobacteria bacterium]
MRTLSPARRRPQVLAGLLVLGAMLAACSTAPVRENNPAAIASRVVAVARRMVGKPYRYGGDSPSGFDCSGLVYYCYERAGEQVPRTTAGQHRDGIWESIRHIHKGDLIFFKERGISSSHVGIYIGHGRFVHAPTTGQTVRIDRLSNPYWLRHFVSVRRFPFMQE